jgi:hypothetical protein
VPRLVIILPLQAMSTGDASTLQDWPLHLTVAPTFVIDGGLPAVLAAVTPLLLSQPPLAVVAGQEYGFGRSGRFPVTLIEPTIELNRLHAQLVGALLAAGAEFDHPEFVGAGYRPHVTIKGDPGVRTGDRMTLRQAAIVDMAPEGEQRVRTVVWTTDLADPGITPSA